MSVLCGKTKNNQIRKSDAGGTDDICCNCNNWCSTRSNCAGRYICVEVCIHNNKKHYPPYLKNYKIQKQSSDACQCKHSYCEELDSQCSKMIYFCDICADMCITEEEHCVDTPNGRFYMLGSVDRMND